jgi:phage tail protein X
MAIQYRCKEGDMLDEICHHYYGQTAGVVEQVLAANSGLAALGPVLPVGTLVTLPEISAREAEQVNLWS